jgi:hypothetical protein
LGPAIHSGGEAISGRFMVPIILLFLMAAPRFNEARAAWRISFLLSAISAFASAQAGTIYHSVIALIYTMKVAVSSWGMPVIFSEYAPSLLDVKTFHTVLVLPSVTFESLTTGIAGISVTKLLWNQTPFFILFLMSLIPGIWMLRGIVTTMKMPKM